MFENTHVRQRNRNILQMFLNYLHYLLSKDIRKVIFTNF